MKSFKKALGLLAGGAVAVGFYACSAKSTDPNDQGNPFQSGGGYANSSSWDASLGGGFANAPNAGGSSFGGGVVFGGANGNGGSGRTTDGCPVVHQKPEQIIVYKDATVTDTIYQSKPVALFIMQDRSGSMVTGFPPPASADSWNNSTAAVTAFVNDPRTAGIDIGLGAFPSGPNNTADCSGGSDCGTPVVPIAPLPQNANAMIQAYSAQMPQNPIADTPTECGLRGMINECLQFMAASTTGEQCVAILITDGTPFNVINNCDTTQANLVQIVADGHAKGVTTYALGLPGADTNFMNNVANAGGTGQAIDVSGGANDFIAALNNIRQTVAITTTTQVTTSTTIATPLPCLWNIPPVPAGTSFEKDKVNVQYTAPGAATATDFGRVTNVGECANVPQGQGAWYYDDNTNPTKVLACPNTCDNQLKNAPGASVDILFGCDSHFIFH